MDSVLKSNASFALSLLYVVTGVVLLGYVAYYRPLEIAAADARRLATIIQSENAPLKEEEERRKKADADPDPGIRSLPTFLEHINRLAQDTNVIIRELMPSRDGALKFVLKINTDYLTFLRFAANLESLNVSINDLQVRPFDPSQTPPLHVIEFSITPRGDAAPLTSERIRALREQVAAKDKRNPFQRFAFIKETKQITPEVDLTWIHRLSGMGRIGDRRVATINTREFGVGDEIEKDSGLRITAIEADLVRLERQTSDGTTKYILRPRRSRLEQPKTP